MMTSRKKKIVKIIIITVSCMATIVFGTLYLLENYFFVPDGTVNVRIKDSSPVFSDDYYWICTSSDSFVLYEKSHVHEWGVFNSYEYWCYDPGAKTGIVTLEYQQYYCDEPGGPSIECDSFEMTFEVYPNGEVRQISGMEPNGQIENWEDFKRELSVARDLTYGKYFKAFLFICIALIEFLSGVFYDIKHLFR